VLLASQPLILVFAFLQPVLTVVYDVSGTWATWPLIALSLFGWGGMLMFSFIINHFDLFGLRQVYLHWRHMARPAPDFKEQVTRPIAVRDGLRNAHRRLCHDVAHRCH